MVEPKNQYEQGIHDAYYNSVNLATQAAVPEYARGVLDWQGATFSAPPVSTTFWDWHSWASYLGLL